jgi:DnaK suppressor protein
MANWPDEPKDNLVDTREFAQLLRQRRKLLWEDVKRELDKHDEHVFADQGVDPGDRAIADLLADLNLTEISRDTDELRAIEHALGRIEAGSYGMCSECGRRIGIDRLRAIPETLLCIDCAERAEARGTGTPSL